MKKGPKCWTPMISLLFIGVSSAIGQSPFPLPIPKRPTNFPISMPAETLFGKDLRALGTIFEWRLENHPCSDAYTALIPLSTPASFPGKICAVNEESAFSAALMHDGSVFTWGQTNFFVVDNLRSFLHSFANQDVLQISTSESLAAVLLDDGSVHVFGLDSTAPSSVAQDVVQMEVGLGHVVALKSDGRVVAWGKVASAILGPDECDPTFPTYVESDVAEILPANLDGVIQVAAAFHHAFALKSDGTVVGWGFRGGDPWELLPAYVPAGLTNVVQIATSESLTAALKNDGTLSVWAFTNSIPAEYSFVLPPANLTNVVKVVLGNGHGMALIKDGTVRSWGRFARPRDGAVDVSLDPLINSLPADSSTWTNIIDISAGNESGYGLVWDGSSGLPPVITKATRESGGFVLEWSDPLNRPVNVQRRTSLNSGSWSNISTNVTAAKFADTSPPALAAFYRLVVP